MSMELATLRRSPEAYVAGVCAGVARRYDVDPTLVRVAMLMLALCSGVGVLLYGLLWATLPADGDAASPLRRAFPDFPRLSERAWTAVATLGSLTVAALLHSLLPFGLLGAIVLLGMARWWARHRATPAAGESWPLLPELPDAFGTPAAPGAALARTAAPAVGPAAAPLAPAGASRVDRAIAPAPRSAGATAVVARRASSARATWAVLGAGLAAGVADSLWQAARGGATFSVTELLAVVAVVLGLGTLAAAITGRPRVLASVSLACALGLGAAIVAPAIPTPVSHHHSGVGDVSAQPTSVADLSDISTGTGDLDIDYSALTLTSDASTSLHTSLGDARVVLPRDVNAVVSWRTSLGSYDGPDGHRDSARTGTYRSVVDSSKPTVTITVSSSLGDIRVVKP